MRYILFILIFFLTGFIPAKSQRYKDSLINLIEKDKVDTVKIIHLIQLSSFYMYNNHQKADSCLEMGLSISKRIKHRPFEADILSMFGNNNYAQAQYEKALNYYDQASALYKKLNDPGGEALCVMNIGLVHINRGNLGKGLHYELEAVKLFEKKGQNGNLAYAYNAIAVVYKEKKDYKKALIYQQKSLRVNEINKSSVGICNNYINIGAIYRIQKKYTLAIKNFNTAIAIAEHKKDFSSLSNAYHEMAEVYFDENKLERAEFYYKKALDLQLQINDQLGAATTYTSLCQIYEIENKPQKSIEFGLKAMELARSINSQQVLELAHLFLSKAYAKTGDFEKAYANMKAYTGINDTLQEAEQKQNLLELQEKYHAENSEKQILALKHKTVQGELKNQKERNFRNVMIGGFLLVTILCLVFIYRFRLKQKSSARLQEAYAIIREKQRETIESINYAKRLQEAILPPARFVQEVLPKSFILYLPKDIVAGDFYFVERVGTYVIFAAADCTGHGVPGALVSVVCSNALHRSIAEFGLRDAGQILDNTRDLVLQTFKKSESEVKDGMDISLCVLNTADMKLSWAGANNPLWLLRKGEHLDYKPDKQPIGKVEKPKPFISHTIQLEPGDALYVFTDGYEDQFGGEKSKKFKSASMLKLVKEIHRYSPEEQKQALVEAFEKWKGKLEQVDDICVIGVFI